MTDKKSLITSTVALVLFTGAPFLWKVDGKFYTASILLEERESAETVWFTLMTDSFITSTRINRQ